MPRHSRNRTSSSCFTSKESGSDDSPAPSNAQFSKRVRKLLEGVSPLKVPAVTPEPKPPKPKTLKPKIPKPKKSPVRKKEPDETSENARRLARLRSLPPISPRGRQFANGVRDGTFTHADVAGEGLSRFLQDGLPRYEVFFGQAAAIYLRNNIEVLRSGDPAEIRKLTYFGDEFEPIDKWSVGERSKVSRYPMAIRTSGVALVVPIKAHVSTRGVSETGSPRGARKTTNDSPETLWMREKMEAIFGASGDKSPIPLPPLDTFDYKDAAGSSSEGGYLPEHIPGPAMQLDSKDWPQSPDGWTTSSSESSDSDSDSDEKDLTSDKKLFREMFPHARYREP